jgi:hypothetical protein
MVSYIDFKGLAVPPQSSTNTKLSSCFEYRGLMIISRYVVGGGLWRLLNINLFRTSARPLKSIYETIIYTIDNDSLNMGPYMALIVPSSFYGVDAGLHALSFSLGFNVHKLYLK